MKIKLDQKGYEEYLNHIEELKNRLNSNSKEKSSSYESAVGDGWHDNFDFEEAKRLENLIISQIENFTKYLKNIEVIKETSNPDNLVNINDLLELKLIFEDGSHILDKFKLVGSNFPKSLVDYDEVSLNSPVGSSIYKAKIGSKVSYTTSNGKKIEAEILRKL